MSARTLRLAQIFVPPNLHRVDIDEQALEDLAHSITTNGLLNPINVQDNGNDSYTLIAGHRRLLAHQRLGRTEIACTVHNGSARDASSARFAENLHRANLSPMEEARAIHHAHHIDLIAISTLARLLNRSQEWISRRLALLEMPLDLQELAHAGTLPLGSALALANVTDEIHRRYLTRYALDAGAAVNVIAEWVRQWQLAGELGDQGAAPLPEMPEPGQPITVTMPCYVCGEAHPYQELRVTRVCGGCMLELNTQDVNHSPPEYHTAQATQREPSTHQNAVRPLTPAEDAVMAAAGPRAPRA